MKASRLAILGGFGLSLGDGIIGLQALFAAQTLGIAPKPSLYRRSGLGVVDGLYELASDFAFVEHLPKHWPPLQACHLAGQFDTIIDMRDFALNPGFRGVAMIDFFLRYLSVDPHGVPAELKRNTWLMSRVTPERPVGLPDRYILVCPSSSMPLRDMPPDIALKVVSLLKTKQLRPVVTQGDLGVAGVSVAERCRNIGELCGLVRHADAVVSTDTAIVHLADAWAVPCLAFFTTHRPEWRVRDYPKCTPIHWPTTELPAALEFSRGADDVAAVQKAWHHHAPALSSIVTDFVERL